jgi:hypothetical protein
MAEFFYVLEFFISIYAKLSLKGLACVSKLTAKRSRTIADDHRPFNRATRLRFDKLRHGKPARLKLSHPAGAG